jgi:hypothetical protein
MELLFADRSLQHTVESTVRSDVHFGPRAAALVRRRLCELVAADNLAIAAAVETLDIRPVDSHAGGFSVNVSPRLRLRFEAGDPIPRVEGGAEIDFSKVGTIRILAIEECDGP